MIYAGLARNEKEAAEALLLASESFCPSSVDLNNAHVRKSFMLQEHPGFGDGSTVVVVNEKNHVMGSAFLISCTMLVGGTLRKGMFLSSISIAEGLRGQGFSCYLMNAALAIAVDHGAEIAIVIARRAVDGYYNRFGFWGVSQYSKLNFNLDTLPDSNEKFDNVILQAATDSDLEICDEMYVNSYKNLSGHCIRGLNIWNYILRKIALLDLSLDIVWSGSLRTAYIVHDGQGNIYEIGLAESGSKFDAKALLAMVSPRSGDLTMHLSPEHPFLEKLKGGDICITLRDCPYGGHMIRVLNSATKKNALAIEETLQWLDCARVTYPCPRDKSYMRTSLNIPLLDQI